LVVQATGVAKATDENAQRKTMFPFRKK